MNKSKHLLADTSVKQYRQPNKKHHSSHYNDTYNQGSAKSMQNAVSESNHSVNKQKVNHNQNTNREQQKSDYSSQDIHYKNAQLSIKQWRRNGGGGFGGS